MAAFAGGKLLFLYVFLPVYILILGFTIFVDYFAGIYIARTEGRKRKLWLICSLVANIGVLAFLNTIIFKLQYNPGNG